MRRLISILVAAAVLFHMTFGCCWEHGAAAALDESSSAECLASDSPIHHDHDGEGHDAKGAACDRAHHGPVHHEHHSPCHGDEGGCLAISSPRHLGSLLPPLVAGSWNGVDCEFSRSLQPAFAAGIFQSDQTLDPPIRIHLLNQVLLI